jgi:hypothetical protein
VGRRAERHERETDRNGLTEWEKERWLKMELAWVRDGH